MNSLISQLKDLEDTVITREDSFVSKFLKDRHLLMGGINGVWFGAENIKIYYILDCGSHITEQITWNDFNDWLEGK
jgi:hypothetical protein